MQNNQLNYTLSLKDLFSNKMASAISSTSKLDSKVSGLNSKMSRMGGALAGAVGVGAIISFGKSVLDSLVNYEYFSASLRTLFKGDKDAATALQGQLVSLAKETPFSLVEIQDATKQLLAYGFAGNKVTKNIRMLGDVASGLKIPFSDIAYLYGTLKTQGRAFAKDINQFTGRGIPIVKELAKQFKVSESEVMKLVEAGKVGFPQIEKAFQDMTKEGGMFFNMMTEQTKTTGGQISALGDNWEQLKVNIGKSQTGIIAGTVGFLNELVGAVSETFARGNRMDLAFEQFGAKQVSMWQKVLDGFNDVITGFNMTTMTTELNLFDSEMQGIVKSSQNSLYDAQLRKAELYRTLAVEAGNFNDGSTGLDDYNRRVALIKGALQEVEGNISLAKKGEGATLAEKVESPLEKLGKASKSTDTKTGGTEISGSKPQSLVINITKLVESLNINTTNLKESASRIREEVSKALLETVNDVNLIAH